MRFARVADILARLQIVAHDGPHVPRKSPPFITESSRHSHRQNGYLLDKPINMPRQRHP